MLTLIFVTTIISTFAFDLFNRTNVYTCSNLMEDINYTLNMFLEVANHTQLTLPEKFFMSNMSCFAATSMKEDLEEELCAQEMDPETLDKRDNLAAYIDKKTAVFCHQDFSQIKRNTFQF